MTAVAEGVDVAEGGRLTATGLIVDAGVMAGEGTWGRMIIRQGAMRPVVEDPKGLREETQHNEDDVFASINASLKYLIQVVYVKFPFQPEGRGVHAREIPRNSATRFQHASSTSDPERV